MRWMTLCCATALVLFVSLASASPPLNADPKLAPWFESLKEPGSATGCCGVADCRITDWRIGKDGYEALVDDKQWPSDGFNEVKTHWIKIPDSVVLHKNNPTQGAVLCYNRYADEAYCFVPGPSS